MKAICLPSGDHCGLLSFAVPLLNWYVCVGGERQHPDRAEFFFLFGIDVRNRISDALAVGRELRARDERKSEEIIGFDRAFCLRHVHFSSA